MSDERDKMSAALKAVVIPRLREGGFTGSFPDFRRSRADYLDLFTFQFDRHGGGFIIELGQCAAGGFTTHWGKHIPAGKVRAWDLPPKQRARIQPQPGSGTDSWFRYDSPAASFSRIAESVLPFLEQADKMFEEFDRVPKLGDTAQHPLSP